jgi:hypothetical protein
VERGRATIASWYAWRFFLQTRFPTRHPGVRSIRWLDGGIKPTYVDRVTSFLGDVGDRTQRTRGEHRFMAIDKRVFINATEDVSSRDVVSNLEIEGGEIPLE